MKHRRSSSRLDAPRLWALPAARCTAVVAGMVLAACTPDAGGLTDPGAGVTVSVLDDLPPNAPVVFLHYDYMVRSWSDPLPMDTTKNFAPDPEAIAEIVSAFRRRGITLVIDPEHTEIPYENLITFVPGSRFCNRGGVQTLAGNFWTLKEKYFRPKSALPWHYALFGQFGCLWGDLISGAADLPGYNMMVTVPFPHRPCFLDTKLDFCKFRQAGTLMHELGHNLDLRHGGDEDENFKPNYLSVMNYQFQGGILSTAPGDTDQFSDWWVAMPQSDRERFVGHRLDYSSGTLPALDERHLDERIGLGGPSGTTDISLYRVGLGCGDYTRFRFIRVDAAPLDWNQNGIIESDVAVDVNWTWTSYFTEFPWLSLCPQYNAGSDEHPLRDFDDWAHLHAFLKTPSYLAGTLRRMRIVGDAPIPVRGDLPHP